MPEDNTNELTSGIATNDSIFSVTSARGIVPDEFSIASLANPFESELDDPEIDTNGLPLQERVRLFLGGHNVDISEEEVTNFLRQKKKKKHLDQIEREFLHKPENDGAKSTCNLNVDDIVE